MSNEEFTFEKVLSIFGDYLAKDDCVEVVKTSRGYAVIEWDDRLGSWIEIEHCPSPTDLQNTLLSDMATFMEYSYTAGNRELSDAERISIMKLQDAIVQKATHTKADIASDLH